MKEQFIHELNDSDVLAEIIKRLTTTYQNTHVISEEALAWVKRIEAQTAQAAVINSLNEGKEFNKIQTVRDDQKQNGKNLAHLLKQLQDQSANTLVQAINPDDAQHLGKKCANCNKMSHF